MPQKRAELELVSLEEVNDRYPGEWVLIKIFEDDEYGYPTKVQVLKHSKSSAVIDRAHRRAREEDPTCELSDYLSGKRMTLDEFRESLSRQTWDEYVNARW